MIEGIIVATSILGLLVLFIILFIVEFQRRRNLHSKEKDRLHSDYRQEILKAQLEIQEQTLKNISQEIHDNIGQVLSLAKLNLGTADTNDPGAAQQKIDVSKNLVGKAIQDLRDLSKSLNTDYVADMGLLRSIEYELEMMKKTGSFETIFEIEGSVQKSGQQKELILFRIVQEVLNNIIKHAKASLITIKLRYLSDGLVINISDNGSGFDPGGYPGNRKPSQGIGIKNMYNRAQMIGGSFSITSTIGHGTSIQIHLPYSTPTI